MKYYIIFSDTDRFWAPFTKKGFGHVAVVFHDEYNWIMVEPTMTNVKVSIPNHRIIDDVPSKYTHEGAHVLEVTVIPDLRERLVGKINILPGICTCVSVILQVTGLRIKAFTPYGLYRKLMKYNDLSVKCRRKVGLLDVRPIVR